MRTTPCLNDAKSKRDPFKCVPFKVQRWPGYQSDAGELVAPVQLQRLKTSRFQFHSPFLPMVRSVHVRQTRARCRFGRATSCLHCRLDKAGADAMLVS
jgi:hypothetical protein